MAVDAKNTLYSNAAADWEQVRDCLAGERVIKRKGVVYLPRLSGQTDEEYDRYRKRVNFFAATARVADGLHGAIFAKPPQISGEAPGGFLESLNDVDLVGTSIDQFASDVCWDTMMTNWGGVLVDYSKDAATVSQAEAERMGCGAYLKWFPAEQVINWRYGVTGGKEKLVMVVLHEPYTEVDPDDMFVEKPYNRYRVLRLEQNPDGTYGKYVQEIYDDKAGLERPVEYIDGIRMNGGYMYFIPFFTVPGKLPEKSMLLDLSFLNIGHYQESADYRNGKHYTSIPTPVALGVKPEIDENGKAKPVYIGGTKFLYFYTENGAPVDVKFLEFTGSGMTALKDGLNLTESQMAILGAHIITAEKKGVESAAVAGIHRAGENGVLAAFTRNVSEQLTKALRLFGEWNGVDSETMAGFNYALNTSYEISEQNAQILSVLLQGRQAGELPKITLFRLLKKIDALPGDWDFDTFLEETEKDSVTPELLELETEPGEEAVR